MANEHPGIYFNTKTGAPVGEGAPSSVHGFSGMFPRGPIHKALRMSSWTQSKATYGDKDLNLPNPHGPFQVEAFFDNDGNACWVSRSVAASAAWALYTFKALDSTTDTLTTYASNPGAWGNGVAQTTAKASTTATTTPINAATTSVVVASILGFEVGDAIYFTDGTNVAVGIARTIDTATNTMTFGAVIMVVGTAVTSASVLTSNTHRARTSLAAGVTAGSFTSMTLTSTSGIKKGSVLIFVPFAGVTALTEVKVTKVEGNIVFFASTSFPTLVAATSRVVSMEFSVDVYDSGAFSQSHTFLSMESESPDYVEKRLGWDTAWPPPTPAPSEDNESTNNILIMDDLAAAVGLATNASTTFGVPTYDFGANTGRSMDITTELGLTNIDFVATRATIEADSIGAAAYDTTPIVAASEDLVVIVNGTTYTIPIPRTLALIAGVAALADRMILWFNYVNARLPEGAMVSAAVTFEPGFVSDMFGSDSGISITGTHTQVLAGLIDSAGGGAWATQTDAGTGDYADSRNVTIVEVKTELESDDPTMGVNATASPPTLFRVLSGSVGTFAVTDDVADTVGSLPDVLGLTKATTFAGLDNWAQYWSRLPIPETKVYMASGLDGSESGFGTGANTYIGQASPRSGIYLFDTVKEIAAFAVPGAVGAAPATPTVIQGAIDWADLRDNIMFVFTCDESDQTPQEAWEWRTYNLNRDSYLAAMYFPWFKVTDPENAAQLYDTVQDGFILGLWSKRVQERGPHIAPANEALAGSIQNVTYDTSNSEMDLLTPAGINVTLNIPGAGIRPYGARTLWAVEDGFHYMTVVNAVNYIKRTLNEKAINVPFEPINDGTFNQVEGLAEEILDGLVNLGAFANRNRAYEVKCDLNTTPSSIVRQSTVICEIALYDFGFFVEKLVFNVAVNLGS